MKTNMGFGDFWFASTSRATVDTDQSCYIMSHLCDVGKRPEKYLNGKSYAFEDTLDVVKRCILTQTVLS